MDLTLLISIAGVVVALLSLIVTIYYNRQSEIGKSPRITGKFFIERWPLITPVPHLQEHDMASTFRLRLELVNLSVPQRTLFLREASVRIWPRRLPFLSKTYHLGEPWLGDVPENAHKTISNDSVEEFRVNPDPFIKYFRQSRWPGAYVAEVSLIDETGSRHTVKIPISEEFAREAKKFLTREEYLDFFRPNQDEDT